MSIDWNTALSVGVPILGGILLFRLTDNQGELHKRFDRLEEQIDEIIKEQKVHAEKHEKETRETSDRERNYQTMTLNLKMEVEKKVQELDHRIDKILKARYGIKT
jgi:DUF4097 and DUF4098 domain-containing protein YvlB